jgi:hypothetical protein
MEVNGVLCQGQRVLKVVECHVPPFKTGVNIQPLLPLLPQLKRSGVCDV